jgi:colanic acid biosynthesis glycosyl transferase WcaI
LRIVLHDYAGHPFQIQLSRELARRGHEVHHIYFASDVTPRGALTPRADDPASLVIKGIDIKGPFDKFSYWKRLRYEREYGANAAAYINEVDPDVLICTNVPVDALAVIRRQCLRPGRQFVIWLQDIVSIGVRAVLRRKLPLLGELIGKRYIALERANLQAADRIVCITGDFLPTLERWGIARERCEVIENWAPLGELQPFEGPQRWMAEQGLEGKRLILYSGTLGLKHNPRLLLEAARRLADRPDIAIVVISEGAGANWLEEQTRAAPLGNLRLLPFQPYERLSEILSSAAVLVAVLEPEAGVFSVPSKVLSYLCIGRPVLLAAPMENLAARTVRRAQAGDVVRPDDVEGFLGAIAALIDDPGRAEALGRNARRFAQQNFEIARIAGRFEDLWGEREGPAQWRPAA